MKFTLAAATLAALTLTPLAPAGAQTTVKTKVSTDTDVHDGVVTRTRKVEHVAKRKTHRPKKVLGVTVGHKTVTHKTVRETSRSSDGEMSTTVRKTD